uniref:Uncharacterized protein n=1 Tax=Arundo donax TaxID=35708 RepID=A0A0A9DJQ3_ARUDO
MVLLVSSASSTILVNLFSIFSVSCSTYWKFCADFDPSDAIPQSLRHNILYLSWLLLAISIFGMIDSLLSPFLSFNLHLSMKYFSSISKMFKFCSTSSTCEHSSPSFWNLQHMQL